MTETIRLHLKPKIKSSHSVIESQTAICVGEVPGYAKIIKNPSPWLIALLNSLDGTKTIDELYQSLLKQGFNVSEIEFNNILQKLQDSALIEDGGKVSHLAEEELERYHRQMIYFSLVEKQGVNGFSYQEKIKAQNIAIFGMGGWGSWIALNFSAAGVGKLTLIDDDTIERSNLNRQILFETDDIGKSKVKTASSRLRKINPNVIITEINQKMQPNEAQLEAILADHTFIIIAWTNLSYFKDNTVEEAIHKVAVRKNIPVIEIGADPLFVSVGPIFPNDGSAVCFDCVKQKVKFDHYSQDPLIKNFQETRLNENRRNLNTLLKSYQSAPALSIMGGLASDQVIKYVTGCEPSILLGNQFKLNLQNYETTYQKFTSQQHCDKCSLDN